MHGLATRADCGFARFWQDETGTTAIEYALIAAGIAGAVIATVSVLGTTLTTNYFDVVYQAAINPEGAGSN